MKPLRIRMTAFGPFPGTQNVDFNDYQDNLFLICGKTGSGKTMIFDAMCYALYGTTSGDMRSGSQMCSNLPNAEDITEVSFDFEIAGRSYRVHRRPKQTKPKPNGEGTVNVQHTANVYELASSSTEAAEEGGELLASRPTEVKQKVQELLGFEAAQFRQVVLIPQGDFRRLLTASSDEREKILKVLFNTSLYSQIEEALRKRVVDLDSECQKVLTQQGECLRDVGAENAEELEEMMGDLKSTGKELRKAQAKAGERFEKINDKFSLTKSVHDKFMELDDAQDEQQKLAGEQAAFAELEEEMTLAKRAQSIGDVANANDEREVAKDNAVEKQVEAMDALKLAVAAIKAAKAKKAASDERQGELETMAREIESLKQMLPVVKKLAQDQSNIVVRKEAILKLAELKEEAKTQAVELAENVASDEAELKRVQKLAGRAGELKLKLENAEAAFSDRESLEKQEKALKQEVAACKLAKNGEVAAKESCVDVQEALRQVEKDWEGSRVHVIAKSLQVNEPCPVCGSTEHPTPAKPSGNESVVNDSALAKARQDEQDAIKELKRHEKKRITAEGQVASLEKEIIRLKKNKHIADNSVATLRKTVKGIRSDLAAATAADGTVKDLNAALSENNKLLSQHESSIKSHEKDINRLDKELVGVKATLQERLADIPKKLRDLDILQSKRENIQEQRDELADLIAANDTAATRAEKLKAVAETHKKGSDKSLKNATDNLSKTKTVLGERLKDAGFNSREEMDVALRNEKEIASLEVDVKQYANKVTANTARVKLAKSQTQGKKRPDIDKIQSDRSEAQQDVASASKAATGNQTEAKNLKRVHDRFNELSKKIQKQDGQRAVFKKLEQVARGNLPGTSRLSLQRYVLAGFLDDVTETATVRLRKMSKGRYELLRAREAMNKQATSGLDLDVRDNFTGETRSVNTLSGGEMFLASLSLALGLSDVVESYSGGVHLDSLFIDEGFGSLDSATLDDAIETLMELNQGGRMVGVISHVSELKERIDKKIEVKRTSKGSRVVF